MYIYVCMYVFKNNNIIQWHILLQNRHENAKINPKSQSNDICNFLLTFENKKVVEQCKAVQKSPAWSCDGFTWPNLLSGPLLCRGMPVNSILNPNTSLVIPEISCPPSNSKIFADFSMISDWIQNGVKLRIYYLLYCEIKTEQENFR